MAYTPAQIRQIIIDAARKAGADARLMLATATVESRLNPGAVGDGGTSFGLFQHHVGGAGGPTLATAQTYTDPVKSATERARAFAAAGAHTGADAARVQRPADPRTYAQRVAAAMRELTAPAAAGATVRAATGAGAPFKWSPLIPELDALAAKHSVRMSSGNRPAGIGAPNSAHRNDRPDVWARDWAGSIPNLNAFYADVKSRYGGNPLITEILPVGHDYSTGPNVHVAGVSTWSADKTAPSSSPATTDVGLKSDAAGAASGLVGGKIVQAAGKQLVTATFVLGGLALVVYGAAKATGTDETLKKMAVMPK